MHNMLLPLSLSLFIYIYEYEGSTGSAWQVVRFWRRLWYVAWRCLGSVCLNVEALCSSNPGWYYSTMLKLGRALGHFIVFLIELKRILFTNSFQKLYKAHLVKP